MRLLHSPPSLSSWPDGNAEARITLIRMLFNLTLEGTFGAIPIIGDSAHVAWKANRHNYNCSSETNNPDDGIRGKTGCLSWVRA